MKMRYKNLSNNINLYSPTQNSIVFHALYSKSKTDKYKASKLQPTLSSPTTSITDYAICNRQVQHLAAGRSVPEASFDYYLKVRVV
jgi:hypothetical protein